MNTIPNIGDKFGDWTVISEGRIRGPKGIFRSWTCKCKCGFEKIFKTSYLNTGKATCCEGCREKKRDSFEESLEKDVIGKRYGSYTVIKFIGKNKYGSRMWWCRCDCGKERKFLTSYLFGKGERRATVCAACYNKVVEIEQRVTDEIPRRFWDKFLYHAKHRKIPVSISKAEAFFKYEQQNKKCALSGEDLYFTKFSSNFTRYTNASLDRVNSELSYSLDNVQWVHKKINVMKHTSSVQEFIDWCKKVIKWSERNPELLVSTIDSEKLYSYIERIK